MPAWAVRVREAGKIEEFHVIGPSAEDARRQGEKRGQVLRVKRKFQLGGGRRLSPSDRAIMFQRLSTMIGSRVGTGEALRLMAETFSGRIGMISGQLRKRIEAGESLVVAMESMGYEAFPESILAIIRTGSQSGDMAGALREAMRFEQEAENIKKESGRGLWSAMGGFASGIVTLLGTTLYAVPEMNKSEMVQQLGGGQLAWVTMTADVLTWIALFSTVIVCAGLFVTRVLRPISPVVIDRLVVRVPYFKDIVLAKRNHVAFYGLGILLRAGLRVEEALRLARDSTERGQVRSDFEAALDAVRNGKSWPMAMQGLHPTDRAALAMSQSREQVADSISSIADQYRGIYKVRMEQLVPATQMLAALFLTAAGVVLFGAIILPLLEMTKSAMSGM